MCVCVCDGGRVLTMGGKEREREGEREGGTRGQGGSKTHRKEGRRARLTPTLTHNNMDGCHLYEGMTTTLYYTITPPHFTVYLASLSITTAICCSGSGLRDNGTSERLVTLTATPAKFGELPRSTVIT